MRQQRKVAPVAYPLKHTGIRRGRLKAAYLRNTRSDLTSYSLTDSIFFFSGNVLDCFRDTFWPGIENFWVGELGVELTEALKSLNRIAVLNMMAHNIHRDFIFPIFQTQIVDWEMLRGAKPSICTDGWRI